MASYTVTMTITTIDGSHPRKWLTDVIGEALENGEDLFGVDFEEIETVVHNGRQFNVRAVFPEEAVDKANQYMMLHDDTSVLTIKDGLVYIASNHDMGTVC